jgi:hypothetical protein
MTACRRAVTGSVGAATAGSDAEVLARGSDALAHSSAASAIWPHEAPVPRIPAFSPWPEVRARPRTLRERHLS